MPGCLQATQKCSTHCSTVHAAAEGMAVRNGTLIHYLTVCCAQRAGKHPKHVAGGEAEGSRPGKSPGPGKG